MVRTILSACFSVSLLVLSWAPAWAANSAGGTLPGAEWDLAVDPAAGSVAERVPEDLSVAAFLNEAEWNARMGPQVDSCTGRAGVAIDLRAGAGASQLLVWNASGDAPDVALVAPEDVASVADQGLLEDLRPWAERVHDDAESLDRENWFVPARLAMEYRGEWIGLPAYITNYTYAYNTALLLERGLVPPAVDEWVTWQAVLATARKATWDQDGDGAPEVVGFVNGATFEQFLPLVRQAGGKVFDAEGKVAFDTPHVREAVEFIRGMNAEGIHSEARTLFWDGRAATERMGSWEVDRLAASEISAGAAAGMQHAARADVAYVTMWTMMRAAPDKEAAWRFLTCLTTAESQRAVVSHGAVPVRRDADMSLAPRPELLQGFLNALEFSDAYPYHARIERIRREFNSAAAELFWGGKPLTRVLAELDQELGDLTP